MTPSLTVAPPNRRAMRAAAVTARLMEALNPLLREAEIRANNESFPTVAMPRLHLQRHVHRVLYETLAKMGADILTDEDRAAAGLEIRDEGGWTPMELHIMEMHYLDAMTRPFPRIVVTKEPL